MRLSTPCYLTVAMLVATSPAWAQSPTTITATSTATDTVTNTVTNSMTNTSTITATNPAINPPMNPGMNPAANPGMTPPTNPMPDPATAGDFQKLSPGNQKIAQALFASQRPATAGPRLTLDQIAELKETAGWGKVFRQMKADGLIQARNLGHVVSSYEHTIHTAGRTGSNGAGRSTVVTNSTHSSPGARFASGGAHHAGGGASGNITTAAGSAPSAGGVAHGGGGSEHGGGHGK